MNSSTYFCRDAYKFCPNITQGWEHGFSSFFAETEKDKKILDVGCGSQAEFLREAHNIYGIDPNLGMQRYNGREEYFKVRPYCIGRCYRALAEELPFRDETFDYAISTKTVGWYPRHINFGMAVGEMLRVVKKKSGVVLFNIGQEMTDGVMAPVLESFQTRAYNVGCIGANLIVLSHPDYESPSNKV